MKKRFFAITAIIICVLMLTISMSALADFGGFSGDSDYGGDWGGSSDSDWGSSGSSSGGGFWIFDGGSDSDYRDGNLSSGDVIIVIIIVAVILFYIWRKNKGQQQQQTPVVTTVQRTDDELLSSIDEYTQIDEGFNAARLQTKLGNLYVQMQNCWTARDITSLRPYLTDELYSQTERQLDSYVKGGQTPHVDNIAVLGVNLRGFYQMECMDHIIVELSSRITTYTTDDATGAVVKGSRDREKFMTYEWDLCRTSGITTAGEDEFKTVNCPNCGAPLSINKSAKCPYCESVITLDEHDWLLFSIKGLSQRTQ